MPSGKNILTNSFKSFKSVVTQWRMFAKMTVYILVALLLLHLAILGLLFKYHPDTYLQGFNGNDLCIFRTYSLTWCKKKLLPLKEDFSFAYFYLGNIVYF